MTTPCEHDFGTPEIHAFCTKCSAVHPKIGASLARPAFPSREREAGVLGGRCGSCGATVALMLADHHAEDGEALCLGSGCLPSHRDGADAAYRPCLCGWLNEGVPDPRNTRHSPRECFNAGDETPSPAPVVPATPPSPRDEGGARDDLRPVWGFLHMLAQRVGPLDDDDRSTARRLFDVMDRMLAAPLPSRGDATSTEPDASADADAGWQAAAEAYDAGFDAARDALEVLYKAARVVEWRGPRFKGPEDAVPEGLFTNACGHCGATQTMFESRRDSHGPRHQPGCELDAALSLAMALLARPSPSAPDVEALVDAFALQVRGAHMGLGSAEGEAAARERLLTHVRSIRRRAHEEAARLVENMGDCAACDLAAEIRSLSEREEGTSNG
jgi:hypothetical protein